MTTRPKAKKFRIRRNATHPVGEGEASGNASAPAQAPGGQAPAAQAQQPQQAARQGQAASADGAVQPLHRAIAPSAGAPQGAARNPAGPAGPQGAAADNLRAGQVQSSQEVSAEEAIDAIRREGLTGRQLRMARRVAQQHNLPATSDFDAVRLLRQKGIDPFSRTNMLELVTPNPNQTGDPANQQRPAQLPQTMPVKKQNLPSTATETGSPAENRSRQIREIQQDIVRRRRRKLAMLFARLSFFVFLPTLIAGWYFYVIATPMYATKSEFLILQADGGAGGGVGGLLAGTGFATSQDSIAVQSYLGSKEVMLRLDEDEGFRDHFSDPDMDAIQRLEPDATNEDMYKSYKKHVKIGYDPTEGVVRMDVSAADPLVATSFSEKLIQYAEQRVNELTEKKREDQMRDSLRAFENAEEERRKAQENLIRLQQEGALLDPEAVIASLRSQITNYEIELQEKELELAAQLDNLRPNKAKVEGLQGDIRRLKTHLEKLNAKMLDSSKGENSLAQLSLRIQMAQADLATRDLMLQSALQQVEETRGEANRQVRYLTTSVVPIPSEAPSYPRKFENTLLAFLVFAGVYLLISLTTTVLREQVTT